MHHQCYLLEMYYTGMTRAKNKLLMIGSKKVIEYMINNVVTKKRNTGLKYKIEMLGED